MDLAFLIFHDQRGIQILNGIPQEPVDRLIALGGSMGRVPTLDASCRTYTAIDPEIVKYLAQELVLEAGHLIHSAEKPHEFTRTSPSRSKPPGARSDPLLRARDRPGPGPQADGVAGP